MKTTVSRLLRWMIGLSLLGVALSTYSLLHKEGFTSGAFCNLNATFNCDVVNQGPYSELFGIPVAVMGVVGYGLLAAASVLKYKTPEDQSLSLFLVVASLGGFAFALYLSGLEAFVLHAWCLICLTSQATILALLAISLTLFFSEQRAPESFFSRLFKRNI